MTAQPTESTAPHAGPPAIVAVIGPTGTGKTELSLDLADAANAAGIRAEIVNADAMQLYRGMDIGTAKLPPEERRGHPHHLFDILEVTEESTVASYQQVARATIEAVVARGALPILVGGSGLYVSSVLYDFSFPARDAAIRNRLEAELDRDGLRALYERLRAADPITAERVGAHNARRIVRALEVLEVSGTSAPAVLPDVPRLWRPATIVLGLRMPREALVPRLDERVLSMWRRGLLGEVRELLDRGLAEGPTASRAIGYAQAAAELAGRVTRDQAISEAQALTRRYARRQVSWFTRYPDVRWVDALGPTDRRAAVLSALGN